MFAASTSQCPPICWTGTVESSSCATSEGGMPKLIRTSTVLPEPVVETTLGFSVLGLTSGGPMF